ncbi:hypothetical protein LH20_00565 [Sphingopyxis sp. 113P3]|nr:hypothetical protein LH20_00565 [Sphingopyxis sp. 113P3]
MRTGVSLTGLKFPPAQADSIKAATPMLVHRIVGARRIDAIVEVQGRGIKGLSGFSTYETAGDFRS